MTRDQFLFSFGVYLQATHITKFRAVECCDVGREIKDPNTGDLLAALRAPPPEIWGNIVPTLRIWEWVRLELGSHPIHISSGYRDSVYNAAIRPTPGAPKSRHIKFEAMDGSSSQSTPFEIAAKLEEHPDAGLMGIGVYRGFVHLDRRGWKARWGLSA